MEAGVEKPLLWATAATVSKESKESSSVTDLISGRREVGCNFLIHFMYVLLLVGSAVFFRLYAHFLSEQDRKTWPTRSDIQNNQLLTNPTGPRCTRAASISNPGQICQEQSFLFLAKECFPLDSNVWHRVFGIFLVLGQGRIASGLGIGTYCKYVILFRGCS